MPTPTRLRKLNRHLALALSLPALLLASPASAQMGGGGMGGGGMGGGRGGGGAGPTGPTQIENESTPDNSIGSHDKPHEMKPLARETFDKAVVELFKQADVNHDGMVTLAELQSLIDSRREAIIRARFKDIDANHDGHIDIDEFIALQHKVGSAASSECSLYAGHLELVPETLALALGSSEKDHALAIAIEPLSATVITKANVHYRPGITLDDLLAYENARFDAADVNHDGFLVQQELETLRHGADRHPDRASWHGERNDRENDPPS